MINKHFLDVPCSSNIDISELTYLLFNRFSSATFKLTPVNETIVAQIIRNITTNAQGVDGITLDMILLTLPRTLGVITAIANKSIQTGVFPEIWKEAIVKPLPKTTCPKELKDLRPISILPFLSKIIEKIVCIQLSEYLHTNNILPHKQSGFRKGRSTATALLDVVDDILTGQDLGEGSILVLLDYSRAFDTINTTVLLSKLVYYGFDSAAIKWFSSYLTGRSQRVQLTDLKGCNRLSNTAFVNKGVPQGSILGPILFILYSADITKSIKESKHHLYADDLQLYKSFKPRDTETATFRLNQDLDRIAEWSENNGLTLNPSKTKYLVIGTKSVLNQIHSNNPKLEIRGEIIEEVTEARNLGILMDSKLRFEKHMTEVARNCFYRLKVLYRIRPYLNADLRVRLCESLILSKLNYADTVVGNCLLGRTRKLIQRVQNACARFSFSIPHRAHVTPFLNKGNMMNMESRRALHFGSLMFSLIKTGNPSYLYNKLNFSRRQRLDSRLMCPQHKTAAFRGSFRYSATKCWNNIPPPIKQSSSVSSFKLKYKNYLLNIQKLK